MRTTLAAFVAAGLLLTLPGCGMFAGDPTVTLVMPDEAGIGAKVTATGAYSEAKAGLEVDILAKGTETPLATTTTNTNGQYKVELTIKEPGKVTYTAIVTEGEKETKSKGRVLLTLAPTTTATKLVGNEEAKLGDKRSLKGTIEPAAARTVVLQSATDGENWTDAGEEVTTTADGTIDLPVPTETAEEKSWRVRVLADKTHAETFTTAAYLGVYDYKAAGKKYLACVKELNDKNDEYEKLPYDLGVLKGSAGRMTKRSSDQAACLRGYNDWPPSVADLIETIAANNDVDADVWNRMSKASTLDEYDDISYEFTADGSSPTQVRAKLGLPKRPAV